MEDDCSGNSVDVWRNLRGMPNTGSDAAAVHIKMTVINKLSRAEKA